MRLGEILRNHRRITDRNQRDVASEIGISLATYSRVERGDDMNGVTLARILVWLMGCAK
jgi:DNA-binding XRE family transcriptional regulator